MNWNPWPDGEARRFCDIVLQSETAFLIYIYPHGEVQSAEAIGFKLSPVIDVIVRIR